MSEHDLGTYQMLWDCPFCGTDKLLGLDHRHCPSCGAAQDEESRYFPSEADRIAVQDHRYHGADLDCSSCSTPNAALALHCVNCGMALAEARTVRTVQSTPKPRKKREQTTGGRKGGLGCGALLLVGLLLGAAWFVINTCTSKQVELQATSRSWERAIQIEQLREVQMGSWCDGLPAGVGAPVRERKVRRQEQVADGQTCVQQQRDNGDGTFTAYEDCQPRFKSVDVTDDWCRWTGTSWIVAREETARGSDSPAWPDPQIRQPGDCLGCEREGARSQSYTVQLAGPDGSSTCAVSEAAWAGFVPGSRWTSSAGLLAGNVRCDTLTPAP